MIKLFPHLPFEPDETPVSWAARQAAFHTGRRLAPFLGDFEIDLYDLLRGKNEAVLKLCDIAGQDPMPVLHNTIRSLGLAESSFRGETLSRKLLIPNSQMRFCPRCLVEDDALGLRPGSARRHRVYWQLAPVRTCRQHNIQLRSWRQQARKEFVYELADVTPTDTAALRQLAECWKHQAPSEMQCYVMNRLAGFYGPKWLDGQSLEQAINATRMLGAELSFGPDQTDKSMTEEMWEQAEAAGWPYVAEGDGGIRRALHTISDRTSRKVAIQQPRQCFGMLYRWLTNTQSKTQPGPIRETVREYIIGTMATKKGGMLLGRPVEEPKFATVAAIASDFKLASKNIRKLLAARGTIPPTAVDLPFGEIVVDCKDLAPVRELLEKTMTRQALHDTIGASFEISNMLIQRGYLRRIQEPHLLVRSQSDAFWVEDARSILDQLARLAPNVERKNRLQKGIYMAAKRAKVSLDFLVENLLAGRLKSVRRLSVRNGFNALLFDPRELVILKYGRRSGMEARLAFMILGLSFEAGLKLLQDYGEGALLETTTFNGKRWVLPEQMASFRERYIVRTRLPLEIGGDMVAIEAAITSAGIMPIPESERLRVKIFRRADLLKLGEI